MENEQVARIVEDFFRRKKEAPLEKIYKEAVKILGDKIGSSRFRGVSTTYSVRHNQTNVGLRYRARYAGITAPNHISRSNVA